MKYPHSRSTNKESCFRISAETSCLNGLAGGSRGASCVIASRLADERTVLGSSSGLECALRLDGGAIRYVTRASHLVRACALWGAEVSFHASHRDRLFVRLTAILRVSLVRLASDS